MSQILGVYRTLRIPARGDAGPREPEAAHGRRGRREREAHLQGPEARREAGALRPATAPRRSWPTSGCASISPCRSPATTPTITRGCPIRSRPSRSDRCGAPSARSRAATASSPSATSTSWASPSEVAEIELILATAEALARARPHRPDRPDQRPAPARRHRRALRIRPGALRERLHQPRQARQDRRRAGSGPSWRAAEPSAGRRGGPDDLARRTGPAQRDRSTTC